jgi:hypothetical protein
MQIGIKELNKYSASRAPPDLCPMIIQAHSAVDTVVQHSISALNKKHRKIYSLKKPISSIQQNKFIQSSEHLTRQVTSDLETSQYLI